MMGWSSAPVSVQEKTVWRSGSRVGFRQDHRRQHGRPQGSLPFPQGQDPL